MVAASALRRLIQERSVWEGDLLPEKEPPEAGMYRNGTGFCRSMREKERYGDVE